MSWACGGQAHRTVRESTAAAIEHAGWCRWLGQRANGLGGALGLGTLRKSLPNDIARLTPVDPR